jgi:hypothetical protein
MSVIAVHGVAIAAVEGSGAEVSVALDKIDENFTNIHSCCSLMLPHVLDNILNVPWEQQLCGYGKIEERRSSECRSE